MNFHAVGKTRIGPAGFPLTIVEQKIRKAYPSKTKTGAQAERKKLSLYTGLAYFTSLITYFLPSMQIH
jgi:hypothetical protein